MPMVPTKGVFIFIYVDKTPDCRILWRDLLLFNGLDDLHNTYYEAK